MLDLVSIGDKLPFGRFEEIDNRFTRAVNFKHEERVVSICTPEIGAGPFQVVFNLPDMESVQSLEYSQGSLVLNDCIGFPVSAGQIYCSDCGLHNDSDFDLGPGINWIKSSLQNNTPSNLLIGIVMGHESKQASAFEKEMSKQFKLAYDLLIDQQFERAALGFKGRGSGFTPAGDDFNTGLLMGLHIRQLGEKKELSKIRTSIYNISLGKNLTANTFLYQAYRGWYNQKWKDLVECMAEQDSSLGGVLHDVLNQGETSGADTLAGFLAAWEISL